MNKSKRCTANKNKFSNWASILVENYWHSFALKHILITVWSNVCIWDNRICKSCKLSRLTFFRYCVVYLKIVFLSIRLLHIVPTRRYNIIFISKWLPYCCRIYMQRNWTEFTVNNRLLKYWLFAITGQIYKVESNNIPHCDTCVSFIGRVKEDNPTNT